MPSDSVPTPQAVLAMQLVRFVRTQGLAGVAFWRETFQVARLDEAALRASLELAASAVDVPDLHGPLVTTRGEGEDVELVLEPSPPPTHLSPRIRWEATPYTMTLAGEAQCFGESLREVLRTAKLLSPWQQLERAQTEAVVRWSTAQLGCGATVPDIVRQWPVFDPAAGYAESQFERGLGEAWLRHHSRLLEPSLPSEGDRMMLAMALQLHQGQPSATFADLVDQSAHASQLLTEAALMRPTAATSPLDASPSMGSTFTPPSAT